MATASQKITLTKFLDVILGHLTEAARRLLPVKKIPLHYLYINQNYYYHAAPKIDNPKANPIPIFAQ